MKTDRYARLMGELAAGVALVGCSGLAPPLDVSTSDSTGDGALLDVGDLGVVSCTSDLECEAFAGCCLEAVCRDAVCMPLYVRGCCTIEGPCAAASALRRGYCEAPCDPGGCVETLRLDLTHCNETLFDLALTAEGIATLVMDDPAADRLAWHLSPTRPFAGLPSLSAGDVLCPSYHGGALSPTCEPLGEGGPVRLGFDTPLTTVPSDLAVLAELWVFADLPASAGHTTPLDGLELQVAPEAEAPVTVWSTRNNPLAPASWTPVLVDLTRWAGLGVRLRFVFDTLDGRDNDHEGVALGRVRIRTACADDRIAPDRGVCELAYRTTVVGLDETLMVFGPPGPGEACQPCSTAENCARADTCDVAICTDSRCEVARVVTADCCTALSRWPGDSSFEGQLGEGWSVTGSWAPSDLRSFSGEGALHFGLSDGSAIALPGESAAGELLSPPVLIPEDDPRWRFWLWLGTEWDLAPASQNPLGIDLLQALVLPETVPATPLTPVAAWDSRAIGGTTLHQWVLVTIDMTPWRGRSVRLGWRFQTGDADANEAEGVWIDRAVVLRECPGCDDGSITPGSPACEGF